MTAALHGGRCGVRRPTDPRNVIFYSLGLMGDNQCIVTALRNGDMDVFEQVYKSYFPRLRAYSMTIVGDRDTASEIVQSLFLSLWENRRQLNPSKSLRNYLLQSVHNNSLRWLRTKSVHDRHNQLIARMIDEVYSDTDTAEGGDAQADQRAMEVLDRLPERSRQVVYMSYIEGKKSREIADELGLSVRTVETILYKSMKKMKKK